MQSRVVPDLVIVRAESDADLEAMSAVRARVEPDLPRPRPQNLRHNLDSNPSLTYLVARIGVEPAGCAFVELIDGPHAEAHLAVVPETRGRGVGSALLAEVSRRATAGGKTELAG